MSITLTWFAAPVDPVRLDVGGVAAADQVAAVKAGAVEPAQERADGAGGDVAAPVRRCRPRGVRRSARTAHRMSARAVDVPGRVGQPDRARGKSGIVFGQRARAAARRVRPGPRSGCARRPPRRTGSAAAGRGRRRGPSRSRRSTPCLAAAGVGDRDVSTPRLTGAHSPTDSKRRRPAARAPRSRRGARSVRRALGLSRNSRSSPLTLKISAFVLAASLPSTWLWNSA